MTARAKTWYIFSSLVCLIFFLMTLGITIYEVVAGIYHFPRLIFHITGTVVWGFMGGAAVKKLYRTHKK